jgi:hypothetical protein
MSEIGLVEIFGMAEAIALIGTLFVIRISPENKHRACQLI